MVSVADGVPSEGRTNKSHDHAAKTTARHAKIMPRFSTRTSNTSLPERVGIMNQSADFIAGTTASNMVSLA